MKKKAKQKKYNWTKIRNEYVQGNISYRNLAKKYKVPIGTLMAVASARREEWGRLRKEFRSKLNEKTILNNAERDADVIQEMKEKERKHIDLFEQVVLSQLVIQDQATKKNVINKNLTPQDINALSATYERCQKMKYKSYNISEKYDIDIPKGVQLVISDDFLPACNLVNDGTG